MSQPSPLDTLFGNALDMGQLSAAALETITVADLGQQIQNALGVSVDDVAQGDVTLFTIDVDDSGSIRMAGNASVVREGHNLVIKSLADSKQHPSILAMCKTINDILLYPYSLVKQAVLMDSRNYDPNKGTPLYDSTIQTLATVIAKRQEFIDAGVSCRTITLLVSDGADIHSRHVASDVFQIVSDMLASEEHIIAAMGIDDGRTDFYRVFTGHTKSACETAKRDGTLNDMKAIGGMGIMPRWVLNPGNSPSEIRAAFMMASQSAVRASQGAGAFSKNAGGFGTP